MAVIVVLTLLADIEATTKRSTVGINEISTIDMADVVWFMCACEKQSCSEGKSRRCICLLGRAAVHHSLGR